MRVDVLALQRFYASRLGEAAQRMAARRVEALWPHADGLDVLGLGYAAPYLEPYRAGSRRTVALMPAAQGVERWPADSAGLAVLGDEGRLPFMDSIFDRVLVVHGLEEAEAPRALMREVWRVMAPEGRLLVIAANRTGLWSLTDRTPFGHGRPYSRRQLAELLADCLFEPMASSRALFVPPWGPSGLAEGFERVGERVWPGFGGLVLMEAVKRLYADAGGKRGKLLLARAPLRRPAANRGAERSERLSKP